MLFFIQTLPRILCDGSIMHAVWVSWICCMGPITGVTNSITGHFYGELQSRIHPCKWGFNAGSLHLWSLTSSHWPKDSLNSAVKLQGAWNQRNGDDKTKLFEFAIYSLYPMATWNPIENRSSVTNSTMELYCVILFCHLLAMANNVLITNSLFAGEVII